MGGQENIWLDGVMGVVVGDALGRPVQFVSREEVAQDPVTGMRGHGTFGLPAGAWTDDSSLTLALLDSIRSRGGIDCDDIMERFVQWLSDGAYTPFGEAYDIGLITVRAIRRYQAAKRPDKCGGDGENECGNGSLMRILPACLFCRAAMRRDGMTEREAVETVHRVGSLTHAHIRANIACGLYFFMALETLDGGGALKERLQRGLDRGFAFYEAFLADHEDLMFYDRLRDLASFAAVPREKIRSGGYVVDTLEAAVWSLITEETFPDTLLKAVNLGDDTDTVGAVAGGLAGLFYGYGAMPAQWLSVILRRAWMEGLCRDVAEACGEA